MSTEAPTYRQKAAATKRERSRRKILETARPMLDEHGWYHVTREKVAKAAGLGSATLYNHFPTKRDMVVAAYEPELLSFVERTEAAIANKVEVETALTAFIRELVTMLTNHRTLCRALLPIGRLENPEDEFHPLLRQLIDLLAKLMESHPTGMETYGRTIQVHAKLTLAVMLGHLSPPTPPCDPEEFVEYQLRIMLL